MLDRHHDQTVPDARGLGDANLQPGAATPVEELAVVIDRMRGLVGALATIAEGLSLEVVLERLVSTACELVHAEYGALGVIGDDGSLDEFITIGFDADMTTLIGPLPTGYGVLGLLMREPCPLRLHDLGGHPEAAGFPPDHPPMVSFLGVPVCVRDAVFGNLYLTGRRGGGDFTSEDEELVVALAAAAGVAIERGETSLLFHDPEELELELAVVETTDAPLVAKHPEIPAELALQGFDSVRAYALDPEESRPFLEGGLGFRSVGATAFELRGEERGSLYVYDVTDTTGVGGAGTVHHVAWASPLDEHEAWRQRVLEAGARPTPVIDRFYFRSIYFREPSGVLFEIATIGPGFTTDEPLEHLGERLSLPPAFEHLREQVEPLLTPLPDPRAFARSRTGLISPVLLL